MNVILPLLRVTACIVSMPAQAESRLRITSSEMATPDLELHTSQGCSSCPPAECWLSRLTNHPGLRSEIILLAFHVDYWDRLGWKALFTSPGHSARQHTYARLHRS